MRIRTALATAVLTLTALTALAGTATAALADDDPFTADATVNIPLSTCSAGDDILAIPINIQPVSQGTETCAGG
ncbi:MAG: hypothetical protein HOY76_10755 [Streptomyces sp.]|nr:hypothetical protein [Streptomyces sp.]NUS15530.1 hypothetical protein [Streptomyces sp.]